MVVKKKREICLMSESISSPNSVSLSALSDLKSFFRSGAVKSGSADNTDEENKTAESTNRDVTRKALSELSEKSYNKNSESALDINRPEVDEESNPLKINRPDNEAQSALEINRPEVDAESNALRINRPDRQTQSALEINRPEVDPESNALRINRPDRQTQSALEINRPEVNPESNALRINRPDRQTQSALEINRPDVNAESNALKINRPDKEAASKTTSPSLPKQKNAILYELRNTMHTKYSAWDIARKYGISYMQAQEIFVDLNQDSNGVVKEFNLPENSTVSYLV